MNSWCILAVLIVEMCQTFSCQKNQAGSSNAMEFFGFKRSLNFLLDQNMNITKFVSDRHLSIAAFMRDTHPEIKHRFDLWHIAKSKLM